MARSAGMMIGENEPEYKKAVYNHGVVAASAGMPRRAMTSATLPEGPPFAHEPPL